MQRLPKGWSHERIRDIIQYYEEPMLNKREADLANDILDELSGALTETLVSNQDHILRSISDIRDQTNFILDLPNISTYTPWEEPYLTDIQSCISDIAKAVENLINHYHSGHRQLRNFAKNLGDIRYRIEKTTEKQDEQTSK